VSAPTEPVAAATTTRDVRVSPHGARETGARVVQVQKSLMVHNDGVAAANREAFRGSLVLNVVSSPGSGKTALLERTVRDLAGDLSVAIVVGDLETDNDAERLHAAGPPRSRSSPAPSATSRRRWSPAPSTSSTSSASTCS
jgi:hypothetical protein